MKTNCLQMLTGGGGRSLINQEYSLLTKGGGLW